MKRGIACHVKKADCFNHVNEHYANRKLGVRPKFNYAVREHVSVTLLQNSIRHTLVCVTLASNLYMGKETLIYIFCRMQIAGLGERVYIVVGTEVATWQTRGQDVTEADFMTPNIHGHLICIYTSCAVAQQL
jgi:hypothetical protein